MFKWGQSLIFYTILSIAIITCAKAGYLPLPILASLFVLAILITVLYPDTMIYSFVLLNFIIIYKKGVSLAEILLIPLSVYSIIKNSNPTTRMSKQLRVLVHTLAVTFFFSVFSFVLQLSNYSNEMVPYSLRFLYRFAEMILIIIIVGKYWGDLGNVTRLLNIIVLFGIFELPFTALEFAYKSSVYGYSLARTSIFGTFFTHHSYLAGVMAIVLYLSGGLFLLTDSIYKKLFYLAGCVSAVLTIMFSGTRSTLLGIVVSVSLYFIVHFRMNRKTIVAIFALIILVPLLYFFTPLGALIADSTTADTSAGTAVDFSAASRILIWDGAIQNFASSNLITKLFGHGIGTYNFILHSFTLWHGHKTITGAHNNALHILSEIGIVGLVLVCLHFFLVFKILSSKNVLSKAFTYLTIALLVSGISQETFWFQDAFPTFWLFYMFCLVLVILYVEHKENDVISVS